MVMRSPLKSKRYQESCTTRIKPFFFERVDSFIEQSVIDGGLLDIEVRSPFSHPASSNIASDLAFWKCDRQAVPTENAVVIAYPDDEVLVMA